MRNKQGIWTWAFALLGAMPLYQSASAHPGATNTEGCHTNRKTGEYHCHATSKTPKEVAEVQKPIVNPVNTVSDAKSPGKILELDYDGFTVWLDCSKRGPIKFRYNAQHDAGSFKRYPDFFLDPNVPAECQQKTTQAYSNGYDRGHQLCNPKNVA